MFAAQQADYEKAAQTKNWPEANGKVVDSWSERSYRTGTVTYYCKYAYVVGGKSYTSSQIQVGNNSTPSLLEKESAVNVHYNPADPADAVIDTNLIMNRKGGWGMLCFLFAGLAFIAGFATTNASASQQKL